MMGYRGWNATGMRLGNKVKSSSGVEVGISPADADPILTCRLPSREKVGFQFHDHDGQLPLD